MKRYLIFMITLVTIMTFGLVLSFSIRLINTHEKTAFEAGIKISDLSWLANSGQISEKDIEEFIEFAKETTSYKKLVEEIDRILEKNGYNSDDFKVTIR